MPSNGLEFKITDVRHLWLQHEPDDGTDGIDHWYRLGLSPAVAGGQSRLPERHHVGRRDPAYSANQLARPSATRKGQWPRPLRSSSKLSASRAARDPLLKRYAPKFPPVAAFTRRRFTTMPVSPSSPRGQEAGRSLLHKRPRNSLLGSTTLWAKNPTGAPFTPAVFGLYGDRGDLHGRSRKASGASRLRAARRAIR